MSRSSIPVSLLARHFRGIKKSLDPAIEGDVKGVHNVRVSSRRLRELLPIVAGSDPGRRVKRLRRFARRLARAFGPVREMDVAIQVLRELERRRSLKGIAAVHQTIRRERDRRRRTMRDQLDRADAARKLKRLAQPETMVSDSAPRDTAALIAARVLSRGARLEDAMEAAGSLYDPERLHQVRIAVKKLRYSLELVSELHFGNASADLKRLKGTQELLGSMHDLDVLASLTRGLDAQISRRGLRRLLVALDEELRRCHAQYLRSRSKLAAVVDRSRQLGLTLVSSSEPAPPAVIITEC